jgi:hypothetical protein
MSKWSWRLTRPEELCFKPVPGGWLFAVPLVWPKRTYLLTDEQKATLSGPLRRMIFVQMVVGIAAAGIVPGLLENRAQLVQWLAIAAICVAIVLASTIYGAIVIRPRLAGLTETTQRITYMDRFRRQAMTYPKPMIVALLLCSLLLFVGDLALGFTERWDLTTVIGSILFGLTTLHSIALLVMRIRQPVQTAS